jgi:hypothetical protein
MENINKNTFKNFAAFLTIQIIDSLKLYITSIVVILVYSLILTYSAMSNDSLYLSEAYNNTFLLIFNLSGLIISSSIFLVLNKPEKRIQIFTLPVSMLSRLISTMIAGVFVPLIIIILSQFLIVNGIIQVIALQDVIKPFVYYPFHGKNAEIFTFYQIASTIYFFIVLQSLVLMVGSLFKKASNAKTMIVGVALFFAFMGLDLLFSAYLYDESFGFIFFDLVFTNTPSSTTLSKLIPIITCYWRVLIYLIVLPVSWYVVFLRYRETEA